MTPQDSAARVRRQGRRVAVGIALLAGAAAAAALVFFLDDIVRASRQTYRIVGLFEDGRRIEEGTEVWVAGRPVGRVTAIDLLPPDPDTTVHFTATIELPAAVREQVRRDSELRLHSPRRMGNGVVEIQPGTAAAPVLRPGDTLRARPVPGLAPVLAAMASFRQALDSLVVAGRALDARIGARAPAAARLAAALTAAATEFGTLARRIDAGPLGEFLEDSTWRVSLARLEATANEIARAFRAHKAAGAAPELAPALDRLARRADRLAGRVAELRAMIEAPHGFPGRWARDPALRNALTAVRAQLDSLMAETRRQPWRYFF